MNSLSADELSARLCTICLNTVVDDNSRGKAELVCGHLFHLDCIGSEFNYRTEMKCPNCREVENGEWLIPDEDIDDDEDFSMRVINRRLELHIYSHGGRARDQNGGEPAIAPMVHYHHHHHNNIVLPPSYGGATAVVYDNDPLSANTLLRAYGSPQPQPQPQPQGSDSGRRATVDRVVLQDRSAPRVNAGDMRSHYDGGAVHDNSATAAMQENRVVQTNMAAHESMSSYDLYDDPSLELTLTTNPTEEQHGTHDPAEPQPFWFHPQDYN